MRQAVAMAPDDPRMQFLMALRALSISQVAEADFATPSQSKRESTLAAANGRRGQRTPASWLAQAGGGSIGRDEPPGRLAGRRCCNTLAGPAIGEAISSPRDDRLGQRVGSCESLSAPVAACGYHYPKTRDHEYDLATVVSEGEESVSRQVRREQLVAIRHLGIEPPVEAVHSGPGEVLIAPAADGANAEGVSARAFGAGKVAGDVGTTVLLEALPGQDLGSAPVALVQPEPPDPSDIAWAGVHTGPTARSEQITGLPTADLAEETHRTFESA